MDTPGEDLGKDLEPGFNALSRALDDGAVVLSSDPGERAWR